MSKSKKDVYNAFLLEGATYKGLYEFPQILPTYDTPNKLIKFSKAVSGKCKDYNQWVHFYEEDYEFFRLWRNPKRYLKRLKRFNGVILPDFSLYRNMPYAKQLDNILNSRAIGNWLQKNGVKVIPNIRFGDYRTYRYSCDGVSSQCVIAVGSHGTMKRKRDREIFINGFEYVITRLQPTVVILYGTFPTELLEKYNGRGVRIIVFESEYATTHKEVV